jgi:spermidine synthase
MKPERKLAETTIPSRARLTLHEHDGSYVIRLNGQTLMHSARAASELLMGDLAVARLTDRPAPCVLIGGLGLGFSLRSVLAKAAPNITVNVAELIPQVVDWNRQFLAEVNGKLVGDPRVTVYCEDVWDVLTRSGRGRYDAILIDIDNGPAAMVHQPNTRLYAASGIRLLLEALQPNGRAAIWSADRDQAFEDRLSSAGFQVEVIRAKLWAKAKRCGCHIYIADKPLKGRPDNTA